MFTRQRLILATITCIALGLFYYGWFCVFGPPYWWGSGTTVTVPVFATHGARDLAPYLHDLAPDTSEGGLDATFQTFPDNVVGTPFRYDEASVCGFSVVQTHAGPQWGDEQHLYIQRGNGDGWNEIFPARSMRFLDATIVCPNSRTIILLARWNPWWPFYASYGRFLLSVFGRDLRSERGVYALDIDGNKLSYLFPGYRLLASPDRRWVAYMTSENGFSGFHNIMLYDTLLSRSSRVLSPFESDPGSGASFAYTWSTDSAALLITGTSSGFTPSQRRNITLRILYMIGTGELFEFDDQETDMRPGLPEQFEMSRSSSAE